MNTAQSSDVPKPKTRLCLAFWRWSWRGWTIFWLFFLSLYFLSAPPVEYLVLSTNDPRPYIRGLNMTYAPANWCAGHSTMLSAIWSREKSALRKTFGSPYQRKASRDNDAEID